MMKNDEFKKLEQKINGENFNKSYKTINIVMTFLSYFGHGASIFLAYFMLSKILSGAITDNIIVVGITTVIILSGLELLKREIFDKFSIQYLKIKNLSKEVLPLFLLSCVIIGISFYASIKGASEFSSKEKKIEIESNETASKYNDSLTKVYNVDIKNIQDQITIKDKIVLDIQTMSLSKKLSKDQRHTIQDITKQKNELEDKIALIKAELDNKIKEHDNIINKEKTSKKSDNEENSMMFVIISTLIELIILAGVYFNEYYKFRSYNEHRIKIEKDPNYQKWLLYDQIINIIYTDDVKINQKLPSNKSIIDSAKVNGVIVLMKDVTDFLKIMNGLGVVKTSGSSRYWSKQKDLSIEALRNQFGVE